MKIGVFGAGAVGCHVGGALALADTDGERIVLVGRDRIRGDVDAHGLHVVDLDGNRRTALRDRWTFSGEPSALADRDVVLCCVKSGATADATETLARVLRPGTLVVSFQNGVRNADRLRERLDHVLAGIVNFNVLAQGNGTFRRATSGPLFVERTTDPRGRAIAVALRRAGFQVEVPDDIRGVQWSKLLLNLNNAVSALSDRPTREIVLTPGYRRVLAALIGEALGVLRAAGIRPARIGPLPVAVIARVLLLPTPLVRVVARAQLKIAPEARSSMWEDLTGGRATEIDWLNGEIVRLADACGAPAPLNRRIVELVHAAERTGGSPKLEAQALWARLRESSAAS